MLGSFARTADPAPLVLNHYVYRSREDYERKARHGFVDAVGRQGPGAPVGRADREFGKHNDVHAPLPAAVVAATAARLAELGYPDELWQAEAHDAAPRRG